MRKILFLYVFALFFIIMGGIASASKDIFEGDWIKTFVAVIFSFAAMAPPMYWALLEVFQDDEGDKRKEHCTTRVISRGCPGCCGRCRCR